MAEHPIIMENKQLKVFVKPANGEGPGNSGKAPVIDGSPKISEAKKTVSQRLSQYAFGEEIAEPWKYEWKSYFEPTGKRVANDIVEHILTMAKHAFQRWIWHGKILDNGKMMDRTSYSTSSSAYQQPIQAKLMMSPVKELTFSTRGEAEAVLRELTDTIQQENQVTVRQYYEASNVPKLCEANGVSSRSGWTNLSKATITEQPDGSGFVINLPRPVSLSATK